MANPFLRRATEFIRDDSEFLSIVSPEPLTAFLARHPKKEMFFDLPVRVIGTPGSGKTMMATLVEYRLVEAILSDQSSQENKTLAAALTATGFSDGERPLIAAVRVPMESEYRDFWELPYEESVRTKLVLSLIQARAMLGLFRNLTAHRRRAVSDVQLNLREDSAAQLEAIGGPDPEGVLARAREVERAVYAVGASLIPPAVEAIPQAANEPYQPFESLRDIELTWRDGERIRLKFLVILDDVHTLHPEQLEMLFRSMSKREMRIGRWMMMRFDALSPATVFQSAGEDALPGMKRDRDYLDILMQQLQSRGGDRRHFRKLANDMSDRYLRLVQTLRDRRYTRFSRLLSEEPPRLTDARAQENREATDREQRRLQVPAARRASVEDLVRSYVAGAQSADVDDDVQQAMTRVLMNRYTVRLAAQAPSLFEEENPEPRTPLKADSDIAEAARLHLHHRFGRPYHFGMGDVSDAANENAELFLQLAGALVDRMEIRAIRNQDPALNPTQQQAILRDKAKEIVDGWSFPFARKIRAFVQHVAAECLENSLQGNAPLGPGANAIAVPDADMDALLQKEDETALVLKYAQAYGAIVAVRGYGQGGKQWCLLELSGPICLAHGLTLRRGGFLERDVGDLVTLIEAV